ncbi:hypothetical protein GS531_10290 [Rhodococcus hoagii]|nr:hypothetical protein [Prescottella equi]
MFGFVVHGSHLMQFARAVGDLDPAFEDVGRLAATGRTRSSHHRRS